MASLKTIAIRERREAMQPRPRLIKGPFDINRAMKRAGYYLSVDETGKRALLRKHGSKT